MIGPRPLLAVQIGRAQLRFRHAVHRLKDERWRAEVLKSFLWAKTRITCPSCGDTVGRNGYQCDDCRDEATGRSNGARLLDGKQSKRPPRILDEHSSKGLPGRMGWNGIGGNLWDNLVRCADEDR